MMNNLYEQEGGPALCSELFDKIYGHNKEEEIDTVWKQSEN